jgi:hypothetical protein
MVASSFAAADIARRQSLEQSKTARIGADLAGLG